MTPGVNEDLPRRLGELGLSEAVERLHSRLGNGPLEPPGAGYLVPFGECLHWIHSLYEVAEDRMFGGLPRQERRKHFEDYNRSTTEGQILGGVVWSRASLAHELLSSGSGSPIWIVVDSDRRPQDDRRVAYEQLVVGLPAVEPVEIVLAYLVGLP
jgi:hypothetical protein